MELIDLGKVQYTEKGSHGWYKKINDLIGIKVYETLTEDVLFEYLITKYVEENNITSTKALALGDVNIGIENAFEDGSDLEERNSSFEEVSLRPAIWMENIVGQTMQQKIDELIAKHGKFTNYDDNYKLVIHHKSMTKYISQYENIVNNLEMLGLDVTDHRENLDNFIIDSNDIMHVIDFSFCAVFLSQELKEIISNSMAHHLTKRVPGEPYFSQLIREGIIRS